MLDISGLSDRDQDQVIEWLETKLLSADLSFLHETVQELYGELRSLMLSNRD